MLPSIKFYFSRLKCNIYLLISGTMRTIKGIISRKIESRLRLLVVVAKRNSISITVKLRSNARTE